MSQHFQRRQFYGHVRNVTPHFWNPIDKHLVEEEMNTPKRDYLGGSYLGYPCERRVRYSYIGKENFDDPRLLRTFARGHLIEDYKIGLIKRAYDLRAVDDDGKQFGFSAKNGRLKGHSDGVIMGGPPETPFQLPALWECKGLNDEGFKSVLRDGIFVHYEHYWAQCIIYMDRIRPVIDGVVRDLTINPAIFTVMNKDTSEVHAELIYFNREAADYYGRRADSILDDPDPEIVPRISDDRNHFTCKVCPYREKCHGPAPKEYLQLLGLNGN
jgi:hypothetical protein